MKTKNLISIILLVIGNACLIGADAFAASTRDTLFLYSFAERGVQTVDDSQMLFKQFLPDEAIDKLNTSSDKTVRYVSPKDPNTTFEHNLVTGDLRFHRNFARYLGDFVPELPTTDEAQKIADMFLTENKLLPNHPSELKLVHIGGLRTTSVIGSPNGLFGQQSGPVIDKLITLTYGRQLNGYPLIGPGSKIILDIGEKGEVLSLTRHWNELSEKVTPISPTETYSLDEALALAKRQISKEFGKNARYEILSSQIAYFDNNGKFLQPVYAFQTKIFLDQQTGAFEYPSIIPVLRKSPELLNLTKLEPKALRVIKSGDSTELPGGSTKRQD